MNPYADMPPGIEVPNLTRGPRGQIPPPPGARLEAGAYNPFPGAGQSSTEWPVAQAGWATPSTPTSPWPGGMLIPPLQSAPSPQGRYPYRSPYHPTPSDSFGGFTPGSWGPPTPASAFSRNIYPEGYGGQEGGSGQPIAASPWFNGGASPGRVLSNWPEDERDAGPERQMGFGKPSPRSAFGEFPMERSWSNEVQGRSRPQLQRSLSTGAGAVKRGKSYGRRKTNGNLQPFDPRMAYMPDDYSPENLARRPKDWRPDYDARPLAAFIPKIQKPRTDVKEFNDPQKRVIHETLSYQQRNPVVSYDLRLPPDDNLDFPLLGRDYNYIDFAQMATQPPADEMRLFHPLLPWYIDVVASHQNGITVQDIIWQMYQQVDVEITAKHIFNDALPESFREKITTAYYDRTAGNPAEASRGIKRVDFLEGNVVFRGLVRGKNGFWEMKTTSE